MSSHVPVCPFSVVLSVSPPGHGICVLHFRAQRQGEVPAKGGNSAGVHANLREQAERQRQLACLMLLQAQSVQGRAALLDLFEQDTQFLLVL